MTIPSGDLRDPANMPGVSDATAALIRLGTKTRSAKDIADTARRTGRDAVVRFGPGRKHDLPEFDDGEFRRRAGLAGGRPAESHVSAGRIGQSGRRAKARQLEQAKARRVFLPTTCS